MAEIENRANLRAYEKKTEDTHTRAASILLCETVYLT